jgi:predicted TIM-barrel fold metal-dependent hydrolase
MTPAPRADTHFHVFRAGVALPGARYTPGYDATLETWQAMAAALGVNHGVLVQTSFMGTDNSLLLAQLAAQPETLRGVAVVSPDANLAVLAPLHTQGVRGIRLNLAGQPHDMGAWAVATALWDAVAQMGWHVELHTDTGALPGVLAALPQALPVVVDHFAKPAKASLQDATVVALRERGRRGGAGGVHVKLSAAYRLGQGVSPQELAWLWRDELGLKALLWGSDWPCTNHESKADYPALHAALDDWLGGGDCKLLHAVRSANPMRLYWGVDLDAGESGNG